MPEQLRVLDLFSGISAASASGLSVPECEPSPSAKSSPTAGPFSQGTGPAFPFLTTCEPSRESQQTLFAEDSLARTSASPASTRVTVGQVLTANEAGSGAPWRALLATYDRATRSWRTSQHCFLETTGDGLAEFSETWPRSGMTRNGTAYQLQPLAPLTSGTESGLLPTPTAREWKDRGRPCVLQKLARGDGVAKEIFKLSRTHRLSRELTAGLNPSFAEWMMGYSPGWTVCTPSEIPSSLKLRNSSGKQS